MSRLIDADALKAFYAHWDSEYSGEELKEYKRIFDSIVDQQPTVEAVPVVRCKDCKWFGQAGCAIRIVDDTDKPTETDYCSFGERRKKVELPRDKIVTYEYDKEISEVIVHTKILVRCKDCKHYIKSDTGHPDFYYCKRLICGTVNPDFYCADGERKENNNG